LPVSCQRDTGLAAELRAVIHDMRQQLSEHILAGHAFGGLVADLPVGGLVTQY
jgi:hypothetical protein